MAKDYGCLGFVDLLNGGQRRIVPTDDLFLNYLFKDEAEWETLRSILNIILAEYIARYPKTSKALVEGDIKVETQYDYYLDASHKKTQDIKVSDSDGKKLIYVEFQNQARPQIPIKVRAWQYFALGVSLSDDGIANQVWLLKENVDDLLEGQTFANYVITNEVTQNLYPNVSSMLFVSLERLSEGAGVAAELASFLLGAKLDASDNRIKEIADRFTNRFAIFKADKEVESKMTRMEEIRLITIEESARAIARRMLERKRPLEEVAADTELPIGEVERLNRELYPIS